MNTAKRNNSIDIFRLIASILVVSIHMEPFLDKNLYLGFFVSQVITRIAVPFFFCISGYYFYQGLQKNKTTITSTFLKYFKFYTFWSAIYYIVNITFSLLNEDKINLFSYIENFLVFGSVYHFWYFVAILFSVAVFGFFYKIKKTKWVAIISIILYVFGVLSSAYYYLFDNISFINIVNGFEHIVTIRRILFTGFPFFYMGVFVNKLFKIEENKKTFWKLIAFTCCFTIEILCIKLFNLADTITITLFLYPLTLYSIIMLLKLPFEGHRNLANKCNGLSSYIYCSHPLLIMLLSYLPFFQKIDNACKMVILLVVCVVSWWIFMIINKKLNSKIIKTYLTGI